MTVYTAIMYLYQVIVGYLLIVLVANLFTTRDIQHQVVGAVVILPFLLRLFLIK